MMSFNNILYLSEPNVDQSQALKKAISFAQRHQAKLTVLEVIPQLRDILNPMPEGLDRVTLNASWPPRDRQIWLKWWSPWWTVRR